MFDRQLKLMICVRFLKLLPKYLLSAITKFRAYWRKIKDIINPDYDVMFF